jgi:hypothetical protein
VVRVEARGEEWVRERWELSPSQAEQAMATPEARRDLAAATEELERRLRADRIPVVVRRPATLLDGRTLLDMAVSGEHAQVRAAVASMFELPR